MYNKFLNFCFTARPVNRMDVTSKLLIANPLINDKIVVATCMSANGKPPSAITWETKLKGEAEYEEIKNDNGTVTVISRYKLVPTREAHRQPLTCVINYQTERDTKNTTIGVQCKYRSCIQNGEPFWGIFLLITKKLCYQSSLSSNHSFRLSVVHNQEHIGYSTDTRIYKIC